MHTGTQGLAWVGLYKAWCFLGKTSQRSTVTAVISPPEFLSVHPAASPPLRAIGPSSRVLSSKALGEEGENSPGAKKLHSRALKFAEVQRQEVRPCIGKGWAVLIANSIPGLACKTTARAAWLPGRRAQACPQQAGAHEGCSQGRGKQLLDVCPQEPEQIMERGEAEPSLRRERSCQAARASCVANPAPANALCGGRQVGSAGLLVSMWA